MEKIKKIVFHFLKLHKQYIAFLKSDLASFLAGIVDYSILALTIYLFKFSTNLSVIVGVFFGGITYFLIANFWAFKDTSRTWRGESWRFLIIWLASLLFNYLGTTFLNSHGINIFISRAITSVIVSILWNFPLDRFWVFKAKKTK